MLLSYISHLCVLSQSCDGVEKLTRGDTALWKTRFAYGSRVRAERPLWSLKLKGQEVHNSDAKYQTKL